VTTLKRPRGYPTVLVVEEDSDQREALAHALRRQGYLVLEAHDRPSALDIVVRHSRAIHLLLTSGSADHRTLATELREYRPVMSVWFIAQPQNQTLSDELTPGTMLAKVRAFFKNPGVESVTGSGHKADPPAIPARQSPAMKAAG
jgi:CheY-like chemotaxis protein